MAEGDTKVSRNKGSKVLQITKRGSGYTYKHTGKNYTFNAKITNENLLTSIPYVN